MVKRARGEVFDRIVSDGCPVQEYGSGPSVPGGRLGWVRS